MKYEEVLKAACAYVAAKNELEAFENRANAKLRFPSDDWTQGQYMRYEDLTQAEFEAEQALLNTAVRYKVCEDLEDQEQ